MNRAKNGCMITIYKCICQAKKHYTMVSIDKIQELLAKWQGIHVGRRWIFYCLRELLDKGLVTRKSRYRNDSNGLVRQRSSMWAITYAGAKYLASKSVTGAFKLLKSIKKYAESKDRRWPKKKDIVEPKDGDRFYPSKEDWKSLLGIIPKSIS